MPFRSVLSPFSLPWLAVLVVAQTLNTCRGADGLTLRVLTFNIRFSTPADGPNQWALRREMVAGLIRGTGCDFVGLQEARPDQIADLRRALPDYACLTRSREASAEVGEGVPLFYLRARWKPDPAAQGTFWLSETPQLPGSRSWGSPLPRIVTWARMIDIATGRGVYWYNTHFSHVVETARRNSAELLLRQIAARKHAEPVVLSGDFNAEESSSTIQTLCGRTSPPGPIALVDAYRAVHSLGIGEGTFHGFQGGRSGIHIDYIFVTPDVRVRAAEILHDNQTGRYPSDHFPVLAELELRFPGGMPHDASLDHVDHVLGDVGGQVGDPLQVSRSGSEVEVELHARRVPLD
jgi:endonuclease/exonuclease/phosphatase family metal-dependent hydrolase